MILLLGTGYSLVSYGAITLRNRRAPVGRSGICYLFRTREELDAIHEKDRLARPTDLIELPAYDLSLEVSRARSSSAPSSKEMGGILHYDSFHARRIGDDQS
jgi:hypothetical protein